MGFRVSGGGRTSRQAASPTGFSFTCARMAGNGNVVPRTCVDLGRIKDMRWDLENDGEAGTMGYQRPAHKGEVGTNVRQVVGRLMKKVP